ncbi:MAG: glycyl-radical enzyme activating protein, partial [Clostridia bacterium]|nr:glycyl-radical enzyme activating protein [Clostridia bacterium]
MDTDQGGYFMQGTVFNIQRFSVDDGPGIRTTVFFKGCPLSCLWCHNPESAEARTEYFYHPEKCILCGGCMAVCQKGCHSFREDEKGAHHIFDRSSCVRCGACAGACPTKAIASVGKMMEAKDVIKEVLSDKIFYESSGGGMTISGGEPLAQPLFAFEVLRLAKAEGLHTAIETSGYASRETLDKILPYTDLFLFDYKARPEDYPRLTGVSADRILENLHYLSERGAHIVLRCPIIPDCNDTAEHYDGIASLGAKIAGIEEITLEPYHPLGISKSEQLGKTPRYDNRKFLEGKTLTETAA